MIFSFDLSVVRRALAALVLAGAATGAGAQLSSGSAELFNDGWRFALCADSIAPAAPAFDDSSWRELDLPHDWSVEHIPSPTLNSCTGYLPGGMGWYRRTFTVADSLPVHYLYFEGIYNRSEVFLNGTRIGGRPNGFVSFYIDITPYLKEGENVLAVKVDHTRQADSRWYTGSGIYRDVYLVGAHATHFVPWGVSWKAPQISDSRARLEVDYATEAAAGHGRLSVVAELFAPDGNRVASKRASVPASGNGTLNISVPRPQRWDLDSPRLYSLSVRLLENSEVIDSMRTSVGFRTLGFDPDHGFAFNGRSVKVKGVCLHHDAGVLGAVVPVQVWERRLRSLKQIGVNAIRMSHNPQAPVVYDLCDRLGLLVMDEASDEWEFPKRKWVEGWNVGTPVFEGSYDFFGEWIERDVADMVRRDRNHPCVAFWSIGNEVDYPNDPYSHPVLDSIAINQPNFGRYNPEAPDARRIGDIAVRLAAVVRGIDDSRPVTGALAGVAMSNETSYPEAVDIVGYNYTEDRYRLDHDKYPSRVIYGSENGHSYDAWLAVRDNEYIFGQFLWTGIDYLGESRSWPSRGLGTGLLDFGSFIKPRGKFRASLWSDTPVAYLGAYERGASDPGLSIDAPAVWNFTEATPVRVVCYTNAHSAELTLNGQTVGERKLRDDATGIIYWDLSFIPGQLSVEAYDADGNAVASDAMYTTGMPAVMRATADVEALTSENPLAHITLEMLDADGHLVSLADNLVDCRVDGPAEILGVEGTGNTDMTLPVARQRRVCGGRLLAYVRRTGAGPVKVRFSSPLLADTELTLHSY